MRSYREGLEGEMMIPEYAPLVGVSALPNFIRPIAKALLPKRVGHLLSCGSKFLPFLTGEWLYMIPTFEMNSHRKWWSDWV